MNENIKFHKEPIKEVRETTRSYWKGCHRSNPPASPIFALGQSLVPRFRFGRFCRNFGSPRILYGNRKCRPHPRSGSLYLCRTDLLLSRSSLTAIQHVSMPRPNINKDSFTSILCYECPLSFQGGFFSPLSREFFSRPSGINKGYSSYSFFTKRMILNQDIIHVLI